MCKISCEHDKLSSGKNQMLTQGPIRLTSRESEDQLLAATLWNFLARDANRTCLESLFLEILDTVGRGVNGSNLFEG